MAPRKAVRRKAKSAMPVTADSNNNDKGPDDIENVPAKKRRIQLLFPLPERPRVVGKVLACGQGDMGQLGLGDDAANFERKRPALVGELFNVVDICAGGMHSVALTHNGRVFTFGCNDEGALGRDSSSEGSEFSPLPTDLPEKVLKISAGDSHSACLLEDGRVFAWGSFRDSHGNMGLTLEGNKRTPVDVLPDHKCCDIASGADHLVILTCKGEVYTVGCAEQGQLGRLSSRSISGESRGGKTPLLQPGLVPTKGRKPIEAIWATTYCTFLREYNTGVMWTFGLNNYNQLLVKVKNKETILHPVSIEIGNVKQIVGGQHHTLILKEDGSVHVIGRKEYGRLGLGTVVEDLSELQPINALMGKNVVNISCGEAQSFAITDDGKLYSWGMGSNHQLGTGSDDDSLVPELIVSKQTEGKRIIRASGGGQHSLFLVEEENQPAQMEIENKDEKPKSSKPKNAGGKQKKAPETEEPKDETPSESASMDKEVEEPTTSKNKKKDKKDANSSIISSSSSTGGKQKKAPETEEPKDETPSESASMDQEVEEPTTSKNKKKDKKDANSSIISSSSSTASKKSGGRRKK